MRWSGNRPKGVRVYEIEGVPVVEIKGPLTSSRSAKFERLREAAQELGKLEVPGLVLDLGLITRLDSTGLGELIAICTVLRRGENIVAIARIPRAAEKLLRELMIGPGWLQDAGGPFDSVEAAVAALRHPPAPQRA